MLAFKPIPCALDLPPATGTLVTTRSAQYSREPIDPIHRLQFALDFKYETRLCHERFIRRQPGSRFIAYGRQFLVTKVLILLREWQRKHAFFIEYGEESGNLECHEGCPLITEPGRHVKTEAETAWEQAAADAYNHFAAQLNQLVCLENDSCAISGYSSEDSTNFGPDKVPSSLFAFPHIPGPINPPGDRVDEELNFDHLDSELQPRSYMMRQLVLYTDVAYDGESKQLASDPYSSLLSRPRAAEQEAMPPLMQGWGFSFMGWLTSVVGSTPKDQSEHTQVTDKRD